MGKQAQPHKNTKKEIDEYKVLFQKQGSGLNFSCIIVIIGLFTDQHNCTCYHMNPKIYLFIYFARERQIDVQMF